MDRDNKKYPTFKLEPEDDERFYPSRVSKILQNTLEDRLKREDFDVQNSPALTEELVRLVRARVKDGCPKMERYKLAVQVIVGENKGQGIRVTSKCMWDPNIDNHASYTFVNDKMFACAMVFGGYFE